MKRFPNRRVLITGAGSGLGQALALEFASKGWRVGVVDLNPKGAQETVHQLEKNGHESLKFICDVVEEESLRKVADEIQEKWGGLDVLINNAGIGWGGPFTEVEDRHWQRVMGINLTGVFNGFKIFVPMMKKQGYGHILSTCSTRALIPLPEISLYNVSKAAVLSLSESLFMELTRYGIEISVIIPNFFKSQFLKEAVYTNENERKKGEKLAGFSRGKVDKIARSAYRGIEKNRFYIFPSWTGRQIARFKRFFPMLYMRIVAMGYRKIPWFR